VSLNKVPSENLSSSDTTVIRTLRTWETHLWPSKDLSIGIKQSVLLFESEPGFVLLGSVHGFLAGGSVVGSVGGSVVVVAFTED
jgi:hypothetical protein